MAFSGIDEVDFRAIGQLSQEGGFPPFESINPKSREFIKTVSAIFSSIVMLPIDRITAKKAVGQPITQKVVLEIAKKPLEGGAARLTNSCLGSALTFGGSAALYPHLQHIYPTTPLVSSALSLAGGSMLDRLLTAPLATLALRMQTQDKTFSMALHETLESKTPWRSLYTGTPSLLIRDFLYLPICIPLAETLKGCFRSNKHSPLTDFFKSTLAFTVSGTAASALCYPFQYMGLMQKDSPHLVSMKHVFLKTVRENGFFGFYRGYKLATLRIALYNGFFGGAVSLGERWVNKP